MSELFSAPAPRRSPWLWVFRLAVVVLAVWLLLPRSVWRGRARTDVSDDVVQTLMSFDRNGDGKLDRSELPERMQGLFDRADSNKDGFITPEELKSLARTQVWVERR